MLAWFTRKKLITDIIMIIYTVCISNNYVSQNHIFDGERNLLALHETLLKVIYIWVMLDTSSVCLLLGCLHNYSYLTVIIGVIIYAFALWTHLMTNIIVHHHIDVVHDITDKFPFLALNTMINLILNLLSVCWRPLVTSLTCLTLSYCRLYIDIEYYLETKGVFSI